MSLALAFILPLTFAVLLAGLGHHLAMYMQELLGLGPLSWIERVCLGALPVVLLLAGLGVVLALVPHGVRPLIARIGLSVLVIGSLAVLCRGAWAAYRAAPLAQRLFGLGYMALCVIAMALALFPARLPSMLIDGPYVAKHDLLGVRVQYSTGNLPTDNAIPHVVSEYLLRDVPFRSERPIMPGQEVTNRPVLAALVVAAFRAATYMPPAQQGPLPRFIYVGQEWPDFSELMRDERGYRVSQAIGVATNALLLLGLGAVAARSAQNSPGAALAVVAVFLTSPYFLFQTYFTWPKALAGFFVIVAWLASSQWRNLPLAGTALGVAYLSHPYAAAFLLAYVAWAAWDVRKAGPDRRALSRQGRALALTRTLIALVAPFLLVVLPWLVWKQFVAIPSDLVAQNLWVPGQRLGDFVWVRVLNVWNTVLPTYMLAYPFDAMSFVRNSSVNAAGAVGVLLGFAALRGLLVSRTWDNSAVLLWGLPALLLIAVFSSPAVPAVHGLQPVIAIVLLFAVHQAWALLGPRVAGCGTAALFLFNALLMARYFRQLL